MAKRGLNEKQIAFAREYVVDLNATKAAIRAGYSEKTAGQIGFELLKKPEIQEEINKFRRTVEERTLRTVADVLADIGKVRQNAMQSVIDPVTGAEVMISHKDALKALELEGKHLGAFIERKDITNSDGSLQQKPSVIMLVAPEE